MSKVNEGNTVLSRFTDEVNFHDLRLSVPIIRNHNYLDRRHRHAVPQRLYGEVYIVINCRAAYGRRRQQHNNTGSACCAHLQMDSSVYSDHVYGSYFIRSRLPLYLNHNGSADTQICGSHRPRHRSETENGGGGETTERSEGPGTRLNHLRHTNNNTAHSMLFSYGRVHLDDHVAGDHCLA